MYVMYACLVVNPVRVGKYATLFNGIAFGVAADVITASS